MPNPQHRMILTEKPKALIVDVAGQVSYVTTYTTADAILNAAAKRVDYTKHKRVELTILFPKDKVKVFFNINKNDTNIVSFDIAKAYTAFYPPTN